jgi:hypothetical protein
MDHKQLQEVAMLAKKRCINELFSSNPATV